MSKLFAAFLIVGVPLLLSLSWFFFWVVKILKASKKRKPRAGNPGAGH